MYKIKFNMKSGREHFLELEDNVSHIEAVDGYQKIAEKALGGNLNAFYFKYEESIENNFSIRTSEIESIELVREP